METTLDLSDLGIAARPLSTEGRPTDIIDLALEEATRIRLEALRAAEESHQALVDAAESEREQILTEAREEAGRILKIAQLEAERLRARAPGEREGGERGAVGGSAKSIVALAIEEARRVRLSAVTEAQAMREGFIRGARGEANEIISQARIAADQEVVDLRAELIAVDDEVRRVQTSFAGILARLDELSAALNSPEPAPRLRQTPREEPRLVEGPDGPTASAGDGDDGASAAEEPVAETSPEPAATVEPVDAPVDPAPVAEPAEATIIYKTAPPPTAPSRGLGGIRGLLSAAPRG